MAQDPYRYFRVEARELVDQLAQGVLDLEKGAPGAQQVPRLLRLAHTLKGAARVVKQAEAADLAHAIEDALAPFRDSAAALPRQDLDALRRLLLGLEGRLAELGPPADTARTAVQPAPEEAFHVLRADLGELDGLLAGIAETHAHVGALRQSAETAQRTRHLADLLAAQLSSPQAGLDHGRPDPARRDGAAGDRLRSLADELRALSRRLERGLASSLDHLDRELEQVRDATEQLRLVPTSRLFLPLERTALDAARELGKEVAFAGRGGEVRLEAQVLTAVEAALVQLVRNAVAHGIEPPGERRAAGRSPAGQVSLTVVRRGRRVVFRCQDDGRGFDLEAVRRAATRKGLPSAEVGRLGADELLALLLAGGISTSGAVTGVAGRGIGLDLVRDIAQRLGGEVAVETGAAAGTTVELTVPLSLAAVEVLMAEAAGAAVAIPLDAVRRTLRAAPADVAVNAGRESLLTDGQALPVVSLARALGAGGGGPNGARPWSAIVVEGAEGLVALSVDRLLGTATTVLRPLPELAPCAAIVAGAWLDAEGTPRLVLDPDALVAEARRAAAPESAAAAAPLPLLVVDDSLTTRMLEQSILESAGYEVHLASSGEEALEAARRTRYGLFLVDIEMPGMDGFTFIERSRADPALRDVPAILVTSRSAPEDRRRGAEVGARGYIAKGEFDQAELLGRIRALVG